ncbi:FtsJ methyltransferase domain containing 1, partial [Perkinsus olseni]
MTREALQMLRLPLPELPHDPSAIGSMFQVSGTEASPVGVSDDSVARARAKLDRARDEIDSVDIAEWRSFSKRLNSLDGLTKEIRSRVGVDAALINNAWAKFYEVLASFGTTIFGSCKAEEKLRTMHLCECPGGFLAALNVYLNITRPEFVPEWQWRGASLNPYHEANDLNQMVDDDALYRRTQDRWWTGPDGSGDILQPGAAQDLWRWFGSRAVDGKCQLVTADGSMDVQYDPNKQESLCLPIIFRELLLAIGLLRPGGTFVMKAYSLLDDSTVASLSLAGSMFDAVEVVKPVASKPANSETYWVCLGFRGLTKNDGEWLRRALAVEDPRLELRSPATASQCFKEFVLAARQAAVKLADRQAEAIKCKLSSWRERDDSDPQPYPKKRKTVESLSGEYVRMLIPHDFDFTSVKPLLPTDAAGRLGGVDSRRASRGTVDDRRHDHEEDAALKELRDRLTDRATFCMEAVTAPASEVSRVAQEEATDWPTFMLTSEQLSGCPGAYKRMTGFAQENNVKIPSSSSVVYSPLVWNASELKALVRKRLLRFEKFPTVQPRSPGDAVACSLTNDERTRAVIAEVLKVHACIDPDHVSTWDTPLHGASAEGTADVSVKMLANHSALVDPFSRQFDPTTRAELLQSAVAGVEALTPGGSSVLLLELSGAPVVAVWLGSLLFRLAQLFGKLKLVQPCS